MSKVVAANFSIGQFFKSASMFTPTSSIVTISAISSGSITFTPALSNYTTIRSASLSWLDSSSLSPFYSITGGGSFQSIDSTTFSFLFSFGSTTTIVTQSNSSFIFNSSSIVGASTRQFSISYLTQSIQSYYDDTVEEAYVQLTIDTTNNENSIKFDTGLLNSTTGEVEFTSNTPIKGGIGTSARGIGSFAIGSGSIAQESASVAEGINTLASGLASHAAGINTIASGQAAFSMGIETDADGMASFAAGSGSWARGDSSVAMGIGTIASASGQVTVGHFNFPLNSPDHLFVVGGGTSGTILGRGNLLEVYGGVGSTYKAVKIDVGSTFYQTYAPPPGFSIYGNTTFNGNVTGSNFNAVGVDAKTIEDPIAGKITTGSFTSNFYRSEYVLGGGLENVLRASAGFDHRGFNFSLSEQTTAPSSTHLWTNSSNRLFYSSSAIILNGGNTLGSAMLIGTNDTNNLELETGGTTRVFISSSGRVGIGTSSPTERLHVDGNLLVTGRITAEEFHTEFVSASIIYQSGSTQFGNSLDDTHIFTGSLKVNGSITGSLFGTASWAINALTASFVNTASTNAFVQNGNSFGATALLGTNDNQNLQFETSGSVRMTISSSGNIGIGTTTPSASLHIQGNLQISTGSLYTYGQNTDIDSGSIRTVMSVATGSYRAAFFDYVLNKSTNARAGTVFSVWNGTSVEWNDVSTNDIGNTTEVNLSVGLSGANVVLYASSSTNDWSMKALSRML
jgi:hypothetical protein